MATVLFESAVRAAVIAASVGLILRVMGVRSASVRHRAWTAVTVVMLMLPILMLAGLKVPLPVLEQAGAGRPPTRQESLGEPRQDSMALESTEGAVAPAEPAAQVAVVDRATEPVVTVVTTAASGDTWRTYAMTAYLIGLGVLLLRLAIGTWQVRRLIRTAASDDGRLVHRACVTPVTVGWLRPVVILPLNWTAWTTPQLNAILAHEHEHVRRLDPLVQWLALLNRAVFWFHPVAWWLERHVSGLAEEACDAVVLSGGQDPGEYSRYLLDLARTASRAGGRVPATGLAMPGARLSHRLRVIHRGVHVPRLSRLRVSLLASLCTIVTAAVAIVSLVHAEATPLSAASSISPLPTTSIAAIDASASAIVAGQVRSAPETGSIVGRVVDADSGASAADVVVLLRRNGEPGSAASATSNDTGQFAMKGVAPGLYYVSISMNGPGFGNLGQRSADDGSLQFVEMKAGDVVTIALRMWRYGAIAGMVLDGDGSPVVGATVQALGRRILAGEGRTVAPRATTDDRGRYRFDRLVPGDYAVYLPATSPSGPLRSAVYPPLFYPNATHLSLARVLSLRGGDELTDIDLRRETVKTFRLSGQVANLPPSGSPVRLEIIEVQPNGTTFDINAHSVEADAQGRFTFNAVVPGSYRLRTLTYPAHQEIEGTLRLSGGRGIYGMGMIVAPAADGDTLWSETPVNVVDKDIDDVVVSVQPGARFVGRVVFEGSREKPSPGMLMSKAFSIGRADGKPLGPYPLPRIEATGEFRTVQFPPGSYTIELHPAMRFPDWHLASIKVAGRDTLGHRIELGSKDVDVTVTFIDRPAGQISGTVVDRANKSRPDASVVICPVDAASWATIAEYSSYPVLQRHTPTQLATFSTFPNFPAGEYYVAGVLPPVPPNWKTPEFLAQLRPRAIRVTVAPGEKTSLEIVAR